MALCHECPRSHNINKSYIYLSFIFSTINKHSLLKNIPKLNFSSPSNGFEKDQRKNPPQKLDLWFLIPVTNSHLISSPFQ
ncbi:hypothetical protein Hanom_Chr14g01267781 [Helianthus anomalus]